MTQEDKRTLWILVVIVSLVFIIGSYSRGTADNVIQSNEGSSSAKSYSGSSTEETYDTGYSWAQDQDTSDFADCQNHFGTGDSEDGCNAYVKENHTGFQSFGSYDCSEDCSGHDAGYAWAEDHDISSYDDCGGDSLSFTEGCEAYVDENY